jgi:hypothetical protein
MTLVDLVLSIGAIIVIILMVVMYSSVQDGEDRKLSPIYIPIRDEHGRRKVIPPPKEDEPVDRLGMVLIGMAILAVLLSVLLRFG